MSKDQSFENQILEEIPKQGRISNTSRFKPKIWKMVRKEGEIRTGLVLYILSLIFLKVIYTTYLGDMQKWLQMFRDGIVSFFTDNTGATVGDLREVTGTRLILQPRFFQGYIAFLIINIVRKIGTYHRINNR